MNDRNQSRLLRATESVMVLFYSALVGMFAALIQSYRFRDGYSDAFAAANNWLVQMTGKIPGLGRVLTLLGQRGYLGACLFGGIVFLALYFLTKCMLAPGSTLGNRLYRSRYCITAAVIVVCVIFQLNNTSLYTWQVAFDGESAAHPVWGIPRPIRADEWSVWSTFAISQGKTGFQAISPVMDGGGVDVTWVSMGGLPAYNAAAFFKPFYWGFLVLGLAGGFSFMWITRCAVLFLASFEFAMRITGKNKGLSLAAACLLFFAPYVQWWFSQSILEILIFYQLILLAADSYVSAQSRCVRWLLSAAMAYCLGCIVMIGYPSWIISFLYLVVPVLVLFFVRGRKNLGWRDAIRLLVPLLAAAAWLLMIVNGSWDTLQRVQHSVYPGQRIFTGGEGLPRFFGGLYDTFFQFVWPVGGNACELASFVSFAPAGLILAVVGMVRRRKCDALQVVLICVEVFFAVFLVFGVPAGFAKMTLLSQCTRSIAALGVTDILLLISALSVKQSMRPGYAALLAIVSTVVNVACFKQFCLGRPYMMLPAAVLYLLAFAAIYGCSADNPRSMRWLSVVICLTMVCATGLVNPVQRGIACVEDLELVQALEQVDDEASALYLMESYYPASNIPLLAGKRTYNSSSVYANVDKWSQLDPTGKYENVYNRMAHTEVELTEEENPVFELMGEDSMKLILPYSKLEELGVDYLISEKDYSDFSFGGCRMIPVGAGNGYTIYRMAYASK